MQDCADVFPLNKKGNTIRYSVNMAGLNGKYNFIYASFFAVVKWCWQLGQ
jgi:hypothetical protein